MMRFRRPLARAFPTDPLVSIERFWRPDLFFAACTVSIGRKACQSESTRASFVADSRTLKFCRRFLAGDDLNPRSRMRLWGGRRGGRWVLRGRGLQPAGGRALGQPEVEVRRAARARVAQ